MLELDYGCRLDLRVLANYVPRLSIKTGGKTGSRQVNASVHVVLVPCG